MAIKILKLDSENHDVAMVFRGLKDAVHEIHLANYNIKNKDDYYRLPDSVRLIYIISTLVRTNDKEFNDLFDQKEDDFAEQYVEWFNKSTSIPTTEKLKLLKGGNP